MNRDSYSLCGFLFLAGALPAWGQSFSGAINGLVTDSSTAVIPHVQVTVTNEGTGAQRRSMTDANGIYTAPELTVGYYTVRAGSPGLAPVERQHVKVDIGGETRVDLTLFATALEQSISVTADGPVLQQDSSSVAEVVD